MRPTRTIFIVWYLLFPAFSFAWEVTDLLFLPKKGQYLSQLQFTSVSGSLRVLINEFDLYREKTSESNFFYSALYGFNNRHSLGFDLSYGSVSYDFEYFLSSRSEYEEGFYDPVFKLKGRLIEDLSYDTSLNYFLSFSPEIIEAKYSTPDKDGNLGRGGSEFTVGMEVGKILKPFQISILSNYTFAGERNKKDAGNTEKTRINRFERLDLTLAGQVDLTPGITGMIFYNYKRDGAKDLIRSGINGYTGESIQKNEDIDINTFGVKFNTQINKNNLITILYRFSNINDYNVKIYSGDVLYSGDIKDMSRNMLSFAWVNQF